MTNNQNNPEKKSGFGGIFDKVKELAFSPEYLEQLHQQEASQTNASGQTQSVSVEETSAPSATVFAKPSNAPSAVDTVVSSNSAPSQDELQKTVKKIYDFLESINKPGVDFLEFWNAVEAMEGGITPANIKNAFVAIKMMSNNAVTKDVLLKTGASYVEELTKTMNADIQGKQLKKEGLQNTLNTEKENLDKDIKATEEQIEKLTTQLTQKKTAAAEIDGRYAPKMAEAERSIVLGSSSLHVVVEDIQKFMTLIEQTIN